MDFFEIMLQQKLAGGGGSGENPDFIGNCTEGSITLLKDNKKYDSWYYATQNMRNLQKLYIAEGVTDLGGFNNCKGLKFIDLPSTIDTLAAFGDCTAVDTVIVRATTPPFFNLGNTFTSTCSYYVPDASVSVYKSESGWSVVADRIFPLSDYVSN